MALSARSMPTSPAGDTILQFTLANGVSTPPPAPPAQGTTRGPAAPAAAGYHTWDFDQFERWYLQPLVDALAPLTKLHAASQVGILHCSSMLHTAQSVALILSFGSAHTCAGR